MRVVVVMALLASAVAVADADDPDQVATEDEPRRERPPPALTPRRDPPPDPRPDQASGIERAPPTPLSHKLLSIPRAILFVPKWALWTLAQPLRFAAYAYEEYQVPGRVTRVTFDAEHKVGAYPVGRYESGFGFTGGLRFVHRDLFGAREPLRVQADAGGSYWLGIGLTAGSGERFGRVRLSLDARFQRRPQEVFYGIGNADVARADPAMPVDPLATEFALETRYREQLARGIVAAEVTIAGSLVGRLSGAVSHRRLGSSANHDTRSIESVYQVDELAGFADPAAQLYGELELVYDSRRATSPYQSPAIDATGWFINAYAGSAHPFVDSNIRYLRYGGEIQRFFDLYGGSRVLALRVLAEQVSDASLATGEIAITDLPRLGGVEYLRGYQNGRFRDRAMTLATAEYTWDLGNFLAAYTFVDIGRVWSSLADVDLEDHRLGFGGGIQLHTWSSFLLRAQLAGSPNGSVFLELALSPAFGRRERLGRFY